MSNGGPLSIQNAPRDLHELIKVKRGVLFRLGHQLALFADDAAEQAFLGASQEQIAQHILEALQRRDNGGGQAVMQAPTPAGAPMPQQPMASPQAPMMQQPMPMQPAMGMPQQPMGVPQMPPVQPPPSMPMQQQPAIPMPQQPGRPPMPGPQMAMPGMGGMPPMPGAPTMPLPPPPPAASGMPPMPSMAAPGGMPGMPTMPQQPPVARQPQTASDPTNAGSRPAMPNMPGMPPMQPQPSMQPAMSPTQPMPQDGNAALAQILQTNFDLAKAIREAGAKNQEWMEEIEGQQGEILEALRASLLTNIYLATQVLNVEPAVLAKLVKMSEIDLSAYIAAFEEGDAEGN
jgi:hypothetical protein